MKGCSARIINTRFASRPTGSMTLILSAIAGEYAVQVSDRRLTRPDGSVFDDEANKAVLFCGRMAFSYTGLGFIEKDRTDIWLTQALVNAKTSSLSEAASSLARQATDALKKSTLSRSLRRLVFTGIGWALLPNEAQVSPIILTVSNALDDTGAWLAYAETEFTVRPNVGPNQQRAFILRSYGQNLPLRELVRTTRYLRRCVERQTGPEPVAKLLADKIRLLADTYPTVGKSLMVSCLPRKAAFSSNQLILTDLSPSAGMTMRNTASFAYLSANGNDVIKYGPNSAYCGTGVRDVKLTRLNETGSDQSIEVIFVGPKP